MRRVSFVVVCLALLSLAGSVWGSQCCEIVNLPFGSSFDKVSNHLPFNLNGDAKLMDGFVRLVPSQPFKAGSVFLDTALDQPYWKAEFDFRVSSPNDFGAADGLAFAFINRYTTDLLGGAGGGLGVIGLNGYAVEFDTYINTDPEAAPGVPWSPGDPGIQEQIISHVGISKTNPFVGLCAYTDVPSFPDNGWFHAEVFFRNGRIQVYLNNRSLGYVRSLVADYNIRNYPGGITVFGLTAATGTGTANFDVDNFFVDALFADDRKYPAAMMKL